MGVLQRVQAGKQRRAKAINSRQDRVELAVGISAPNYKTVVASPLFHIDVP